jgi:hypothetical protein
MEAIHGNAHLRPEPDRVAGPGCFHAADLWAIGWGVAAAQALRRARDVRLAALWLDFPGGPAGDCAGGFRRLPHFRSRSAGHPGRSAEPSAQATFLLFKFHALNPMLAATWPRPNSRACPGAWNPWHPLCGAGTRSSPFSSGAWPTGSCCCCRKTSAAQERAPLCGRFRSARADHFKIALRPDHRGS